MNTFGKILVFCNLVVAVTILGFFMWWRGHQENWAIYANDLKNQVIVSTTNSEVKDGTVQNLNMEAKRKGEQKESAEKEKREMEDRYKELLKEANAKAQALDLNDTAKGLNYERALNEIVRLRLQNKFMADQLQNSEQAKNELLDKYNQARKDSENYKSDRETTQQRNVELAKLIRERDKAIQELTKNSGPGGATTTTIVRGPNDPNPPPVRVKGKVMQVSRDMHDGAGQLVTLSVGIDQGVAVEHTLDVYRTVPSAEWLGTVRIISVTARESVGRLVRSNAANTVLRSGDQVVDTIASLGRQ